MDFLNFVQEGVEKSNRSLAAIAEVDSIFATVNADLKKYPLGELRLDRRISTIAQISSFGASVTGAESDYIKHDKVVLSLKTSKGTLAEDVAGWKQRVTGYPCVLKFDGQELSCGNASHLVSGISELLASVGFGNAVNRLTKMALERAEPKLANAQESSESSYVMLVNKPGAKHVAKAAAKGTKKPAATKGAVRPYAAKTLTKPGAVKLTKKPVAAKAPAKPQIGKISSSQSPDGEPIRDKSGRDSQLGVSGRLSN